MVLKKIISKQLQQFGKVLEQRYNKYTDLDSMILILVVFGRVSQDMFSIYKMVGPEVVKQEVLWPWQHLVIIKNILKILEGC